MVQAIGFIYESREENLNRVSSSVNMTFKQIPARAAAYFCKCQHKAQPTLAQAIFYKMLHSLHFFIIISVDKLLTFKNLFAIIQSFYIHHLIA